MDSTTSPEPKLESIVPPPNGVHTLDLAYCLIRCLELEISRPKIKFLPLACDRLLRQNINSYSDVQTTVAKVKQAARSTEDWEGQDKYIVNIKALETSLKKIVEKFENTPKEALLGDVVAGHSPPSDSYEASLDSLRKLRDAIKHYCNHWSIMDEYIEYILQSIECGVESCFMTKPVCPTSDVREVENSKGVREKFGRLKVRVRQETEPERMMVVTSSVLLGRQLQECTVENVLLYLLTLTRGYYESPESFEAEVKCQLFDSYLNTILQLFDIKDNLRHLHPVFGYPDNETKLRKVLDKFDTTIILILQKSIGERFEREIRDTVWETLASLNFLTKVWNRDEFGLDNGGCSRASRCFRMGYTRTHCDSVTEKTKVPPALTRVLPDVQRPFFEECIEYSRICRALTDHYDLKKRTDSLAINLQGFVEQAYDVLKKAKALSVPLTELSHGRMCATLFWPLKNRLTCLRDDTPEGFGWDKWVKAIDEARERDISTFRELRMRMTYLFGENTAIPAIESDQEVVEAEGRWCEVEVKIDVPEILDYSETEAYDDGDDCTVS